MALLSISGGFLDHCRFIRRCVWLVSHLSWVF